MTISRSLSGVFCDDIREELYGKKTLVGCYAGEMQVERFPITLPKLCVHAILQTSAAEPFGEVTLLVLKDDEIIGRGEIPVLEAFADDVDANLLNRFDFQFIFSSLPLDGECVLKVRAQVDGEEIRGLALQVKAKDPVELPE